jgi:hypothetical protein
MLAIQLLLLVGCVPQALPKTGGPKTMSEVNQGPISELDLPVVERQLAGEARAAADTRTAVQIVRTVHSKKVSYVLYRMRNNDGLAVVSKQGPDVRIRERIPVITGDPRSNPITYNAIAAGNRWDPDNGVLFGIVHNPYIKSIEAAFRDTTRVKTDVSQSRGFIFVRPGTDTRFVQISAFGDGGMWWTHDTR